jgi:hypothetical protein
MRATLLWIGCAWCVPPAAADEATVRPAELNPATTRSGYLARLLINETPFPGEPSWVSEEDTQNAMLAILHVLHNRLEHIPPGYRQEDIADTRADDILDVITAGGVKGQCNGFYQDRRGALRMTRRVQKRISYLMRIAGEGRPGRFARLINFAQNLADTYFEQGIASTDPYSSLQRIGSIQVTGLAYSWMTDRDRLRPGGNFVRIPDEEMGVLGGNRFFTLKRLEADEEMTNDEIRMTKDKQNGLSRNKAE